MKRKPKPAEPRMCPYWHEVDADFLMMDPRVGYCLGAAHGKPRFPSATTAWRYCGSDFTQCEGFRRRTARVR